MLKDKFGQSMCADFLFFEHVLVVDFLPNV